MWDMPVPPRGESCRLQQSVAVVWGMPSAKAQKFLGGLFRADCESPTVSSVSAQNSRFPQSRRAAALAFCRVACGFPSPSTESSDSRNWGCCMPLDIEAIHCFFLFFLKELSRYCVELKKSQRSRRPLHWPPLAAVLTEILMKRVQTSGLSAPSIRA